MKQRVERWLQKDYRSTFYERLELLHECESLYAGLSYPERYGMSLKYILARVSVFLQPEELLVGSVREFVPNEEQKRLGDEQGAYWQRLPDEEKQKRVFWFYSNLWLKNRSPWFYSFGHMALDWKALIAVGLGGLKAKAERLREEAEAPCKTAFRNGAIHCYEALSDYIRRYASLAESERSEIAPALRRIAQDGAQTLFEALQLIWLVALPVIKVCGCGVLNFSRMDQYLLPYYEADLAAGRLTRAGAVDLLEEFFFKNNEIMAPVDHMSLDSDKTNYTLEVAFDDPNYLTVGGWRPDGSSGVNALSHIMVEAQHRLSQRNPFMVVRWHKGIDESFWRKVCAAMRDNATVVLYNDETMLPALRSMGAKEPEIYDYGFFGCNDPNIPAYEGGLREVWFNLMRPLDWALHSGDDPIEPLNGKSSPGCRFPLKDRMTGLMQGPYYGLETPGVETVTGMESFLELYRRQVEHMLLCYREDLERDMQIEREYNENGFRIEDCFLKGTLEEGITWNNGGTKYHKIVAQGCGIATVADSLYAIEKLVFQDREMNLSELAELLAKDYEDNEALAARLHKKFPKFGNDIAAVDRYAAITAEIFCDAVQKANAPQYLYALWPALSTDRDFALMGSFVGATPDGRRKGSPISENQSPSEGADRAGITALLNSVARIPFHRITGGPLNIRIHPSAVSGESGVNVLAALFQTYMESGGMQLQVNVVGKETLLDAQKNPKKYAGLCVRVTGYSAYFTQMGKEAQDEMIRRTEQA